MYVTPPNLFVFRTTVVFDFDEMMTANLRVAKEIQALDVQKSPLAVAIIEAILANTGVKK